METLWADIRFTFRQLARNKIFTAVAVTSLALGIGANTAVFCLVNALLLRPLPVQEPSRLAAVATTLGDSPDPIAISWLNFRDLRERAKGFSGMAAHANLPLTLGSGGGGEPEQVLGQIVSGSFFEVLGVDAALGRTFNREEGTVEGASSVAVLSHNFWQRRFGGDPRLVGRSIQVNNQKVAVIGIAPKDFYGALSTYPTDLWVPDSMWRQILTGTFRQDIQKRNMGAFSVVARLAPGVSLAAAGAEAKTVIRQLVAEFPEISEDLGIVVYPLDQARMRPKARKELTLGATLLMTGAGLVLLIACVNLSSLLLGRVLARQREIAVRTAIGAGQGRLARMLMTESAVLSLLGGCVGLLLALWLRRLAWALRPPRLPENMDLGIDLQVFLFTLGLTLLTGLLFGLAPALQMRSRNLAQVLRGKSFAGGIAALGARWSFRNLLVSLQIALSLISLVGGALFLRALLNARALDLGFEKENLFVVSIDPSAVGYDDARAQQLYDRLTERIGGLPGVASAAVAESLNLYPVGFLRTQIRIESKDPEDLHMTQVNTVAPGYFETLGIPLLQGRDFSRADRAGAPPVAVINEAMAREHWPGESAVGKRFSVIATGEVFEVIGVARNARYRQVDEEPFPYIYQSVLQHFSSPVFLHVRTESAPAGVLPAVRREIHSAEPDLALANLWTISDVLDRSLWASRMAAILLSVFGALGLLLAMVGLYGTLAYSVSRRQHEIGIRMALGAQRSEVLWMIVRQGMQLAAAGLVVGLVAAFTTARVALSSLSLGWNDPLSFVGASLVLMLTVFLTNLIVARKATVVDPLRSLRSE